MVLCLIFIYIYIIIFVHVYISYADVFHKCTYIYTHVYTLIYIYIHMYTVYVYAYESIDRSCSLHLVSKCSLALIFFERCGAGSSTDPTMWCRKRWGSSKRPAETSMGRSSKDSQLISVWTLMMSNMIQQIGFQTQLITGAFLYRS